MTLAVLGRASLAWWAAWAGITGCGGAPRSATGISAGAAAQAQQASRASLAASRQTGPERSHEFALLQGKAIGPFVATDAEGGLVAWLMPRERGGGQDLVVVPLLGDGAPLRDARAIAQVPRDATALSVERSGGPERGWLVAYSALLDRGEALSVVGVAYDGSARGVPSDVQRTSDHIRWETLVPTPHGALAVWAEETTSGSANLLAAPLEPTGKPRGQPVRVATGISRWQAVPAGEGAGLALVSMAAGEKAGTLTWVRLDGDGRPMGPGVVVARQPTVSGEVEVVSARDGYLLGWTDATGEDAEVVLAAIDASGHVRGPAPALQPVGGSSLVRLASGPAGVALAWEEPRGSRRPRRHLHFALVATDDALIAEPLTSLEIPSNAPPELVATDRGFAVLTTAPLVAPSASADAWPRGALVPTFIRFGPRLEVLQTEPLLVGPHGGKAAGLGWGLRCRRDERCAALAALTEAPTPVYVVDLSARTSLYRAPTVPPRSPDTPRVTGVATIATGSFQDLAAAEIGDATVVALLSDVGDGGSRRERLSRITLRAVGLDGRARGAQRTLCSRAASSGGVAMAAAGPEEVGVAWVAREGAGSQVHLARLDRSAHMTRDLEVARSNAEVSDVALAWTGDGWVVGWIDGHAGAGDVVAARVDRDLKRATRSRHVTPGGGDPAELALAGRGDTVWVAWSDSKDSPREGAADVFAATLRAADASPTSEPIRVLSTAGQSQSPRLATTPDGGALIVWIEDAPTGLEGPAAAMVARLDGEGRVTRTPTVLDLPKGERPTAVSLIPEGDGARAVIAHVGSAGVTLDTLRIAADGAAAPAVGPLFDLDAPASFEIALASTPSALVFSDVTESQGVHRIRHAKAVWGRSSLTQPAQSVGR